MLGRNGIVRTTKCDGWLSVLVCQAVSKLRDLRDWSSRTQRSRCIASLGRWPLFDGDAAFVGADVFTLTGEEGVRVEIVGGNLLPDEGLESGHERRLHGRLATQDPHDVLGAVPGVLAVVDDRVRAVIGLNDLVVGFLLLAG